MPALIDSILPKKGSSCVAYTQCNVGLPDVLVLQVDVYNLHELPLKG